MVLHAADLYWSYPGERVFSVSANGVPVLTDYDVIAEAGEEPSGLGHEHRHRRNMHCLPSRCQCRARLREHVCYMPAHVKVSGGQAYIMKWPLSTDLPRADQMRLDLWVHAPGGPFAAAVASFNVTADKKGSIALTWTASTDQAIVGGLELYHSKRQSSRDPADVFASVVPPAAEPSYSPLDFSASNLQAAAPGPLLSAG